MNTTSPRSSLAKLGLYSKPKPFKVMVLGQSGVGKSALVVRFITRRYIGEYDPSLEKVYAFHTVMDNEVMDFEILDSAGEPHQDSDCMNLETHIRWAEAFILMYSVTDKCSFDECNRLKFLINYNKRRRRLGTSSGKESILDVPVVLVGNKTDLWGDRMVSTEDGHRRSKEIGCVCFHEISVRESIEQVWGVFRDVCSFWRVHNKSARLRHGLSGGGGGSTDRDHIFGSYDIPDPASDHALGRRWTEVDLEEVADDDESSASTSTSDGGGGGGNSVSPFRGRASTDGHLAPRPQRWRHPPPPAARPPPRPPQRRMSISMRGAGDNATY